MTEQAPHPIEKEVNNFISNIEGLYDSFLLSMRSLIKTRKTFNNNLADFENKYCHIYQLEEDGTEMVSVTPEYYHRWNQLKRICTRLEASKRTVPASFVVALVSQYDAFLGSLIKVLFDLKPDMINLSDKSFTYSELVTFGSIEAAKTHIIEKEVETVLRNSHIEQFSWLENKFGISFKKGLDSWAQFVEITERRNLLVHTGGIVSSQYIKNCKEHKVNFESDYKPGDELKIDSEYVAKTHKFILEIGIKIAHVLWRKLDNTTKEQADKHINKIAYELIVEQNYSLAANLLELATSDIFKKGSSEVMQRLFIINKSQSYKWMGDKNKSDKVLDELDWSASRNDFQLAYYVLKDDFVAAATIMSRIGNGKGAEIKQHEYNDWPLFQEFVKTDAFIEVYQTLFNEPFTQIAQVGKEIND